MKKKIITLLVALMATAASVHAQQISVVAPNGATTLYRTFPDAIKGATAGSVVYLPGGGFSIPDSVKITKKLTIIGIGHKAKNDNVDGNTIINGNLWFNEGSSGSAVMGCYLSGDINIGEGNAEVNDVLIKYSNLNSVQVKNENCKATIIRQCYVRETSNFSGSNPLISNNIMKTILHINGGSISYNIFTGYNTDKINFAWGEYSVLAPNSTIKNNIGTPWGTYYGYEFVMGSENSSVIANMTKGNLGEDPINIGDVDWNDVFVNYNGGAVSTASNFHFKDEYKEYENQVGIYAGDGFSDGALPPVPYIVAKKIDDKTDAAGKLNIKVRVKASE